MLTASALPNVREFLARALPWPQGAGQFYVNVHYAVFDTDANGQPKLDAHGRARKIFPGRACATVDQAAWWVQAQNKANNGVGTDVYVCMSAQREATPATSKKTGKPYLKALRRRENAHLLKSLYIDVDVKPGDLQHGYATTEEAVVEFTRIRKELGLPAPSFVIKSGSGGFHAHWTFVEPIGPERWAALSGAFMGGLQAKGFRGDSQCVVDVTRLLRLPGTFNHKGGAKNPVTLFCAPGPDYFVETLEAALEPYKGVYAAPAVRAMPRLGPPAAVFAGRQLAALDEGVDLYRPKLFELAGACPFVAATVVDGGKMNNNPLWLQTANIALFLDDGRNALHTMSSGHPTYTAAETDALFDRQMATKQARNMGFPRCQTIASYGAPQCASCPHLAAGRSPFNFVVPPQVTPPPSPQVQLLAQPAPPAVQAPLPPAYAYDADGFVCLVETDDQGQQVYTRLCTFLMEKPWLQQDPHVLNFSTHTHTGTERQLRVPYEAIADKNALPKLLAKQGMLVQNGEAKRLGAFMVSWIERLRADRQNIIQSKPYGWSVKEGKVEGFTFAGYTWSALPPRPAATPDPTLAMQYEPTGELDPWIKAARMITDQRRPALDAILAAAFAAPLVKFTGQTGLLMTTYSLESGIGKSTALRTAQAVWGNPTKAVQTLIDTVNSVLRKIGDIRHLPLFWDELKTAEDTENFVRLAFQLTQGKEKSRLSADTSYRDPGTWQTLLCSTSNGSVLSAIVGHTKTTAAGLYRVFEFVVPPPDPAKFTNAVEAQLTTSRLDDNYGWAGLRYAQFLGEHHERVAKEVAELAKRIEAQYSVRAEERFWLALVTVIIAGARYANELQLTNFDINMLAKFMLSRFEDMRAERKATTVDMNADINVMSILARYLNESRRYHTVITTHVHRGSGRPPLFIHGQPNAITLSGKTNEQMIRSVRIQIGETDRWVRMSKAPFDHWLEQQGIQPAIITRLLEKNFGVKTIHSRLCAGTSLVTAKEFLLEFNYGDPVFGEIIEI